MFSNPHPDSSEIHALRFLPPAPPRPAGAELGNVLNEGALEAVRRRGEAITQADINNAVDRVLQVRGARALFVHFLQ